MLTDPKIEIIWYIFTFASQYGVASTLSILKMIVITNQLCREAVGWCRYSLAGLELTLCIKQNLTLYYCYIYLVSCDTLCVYT